MKILKHWQLAILGALLGVLASFVFFAISVITTYHIDLGIAEFLFPYSAIIDPYNIFGGVALVLAAIQWPLYGFIGGIALGMRRDSSARQSVRLIISVIIIVHLIASGVAYYYRSRRQFIIGRNLTTHSTRADLARMSFSKLKASPNSSRRVNSGVRPNDAV